jgi:hypothetical protein
MKGAKITTGCSGRKREQRTPLPGRKESCLLDTARLPGPQRTAPSRCQWKEPERCSLYNKNEDDRCLPCRFAHMRQDRGNKRYKQEYSTLWPPDCSCLLIQMHTCLWSMVYCLQLLLRKSQRTRRDRERGFYTTVPQRFNAGAGGVCDALYGALNCIQSSIWRAPIWLSHIPTSANMFRVLVCHICMPLSH